MSNWTAEELYGYRELTKYQRVAVDRLSRLLACERTLTQVYAAAREAKLIGPDAGAAELIVAIRSLTSAKGDQP